MSAVKFLHLLHPYSYPSIFPSFYLYISHYFFCLLALVSPSIPPASYLPFFLLCFFCLVHFGPQKNDWGRFNHLINLHVVILKFIRHLFPLQHAIPMQVVLPFKNDTWLKHSLLYVKLLLHCISSSFLSIFSSLRFLSSCFFFIPLHDQEVYSSAFQMFFHMHFS